MTPMSTAYEQTGRTSQKARTRAALIAAARQLIADGETPTVELAAAAASISRATAYRYFPSQRDLLVASHPEVQTRSMLGPGAPDDPAARLEIVVDAFLSLILDTERQQRTSLRLSLESAPPERGALALRQGRAIGWFGEALEPLRGRVPDAALQRLVLAIRSAVGIEALVWLTDIAGLPRAEAADVMRWSARTMLQAVLSEHPLDGPRA